MSTQRTRAETIARLLAHGVTADEIAEIAAQEAADQARRVLHTQQYPAPPKRTHRSLVPALPAPRPAAPLARSTPLVPVQPPKARYRLRNWHAYNQALVQRGSLTIWMATDTIQAWRNHVQNGERGRDRTYTELAILTILTLQAVYHLPLRATEGFVTSIMQLAQIDLPIPDYSTLSRRRTTLTVRLPRQPHTHPLHLVVDSTGLKVYGEGEWTVRQHGYSKRRTWRKLHLGVDAATHEIVASVITEHTTTDGEALPALLAHVEGPLDQVTTDGAYDTEGCYGAITARDARAVIPPRVDAVLNPGPGWDARNATLMRIAAIGRATWKQECAYHRRSLAETAMSRLKRIFGDHLQSRTRDGQVVEGAIRCAVLNRMTHLGMPDSVLQPAG